MSVDRNLTRPDFWETVPLSEMTEAEWEALCDGCGLCCLVKLEDEDTGEVDYTRVICSLSDPETAQCSDYPNRHRNVPECVPLTLERIGQFHWLPPTCAYRLLYEGKPLPDWHPLISGDPLSPQKSGYGVTNYAPVPLRREIDLEDFIIQLRDATK
ncbi:hypothetical protein SAMN05443662_0484 [Sulfurivirga caldicuralii]|uniref:UPF0260 protein SAMN05443662_0484 n=2 Tax=Sulfurivirga caldicuralii TaxID=364032 RepID=A0A1N6DY82_9GAMM|nr:YcgN family cysteine cluster protein [Sulfurivirga caldicuralii]SIN75725.1 hypothetical protein SAMN05443662_0484 [Sulfurivirga caldicuralii]